MSRKKTGAFLRIGAFLMVALLMVTSSVRPVGALTEQEYNLYWQNSIFFYDPYECLEDYASDNNETPDWWDPDNPTDCAGVNSYDERIRQYLPEVRRIAEQYNLPWEGIMAQMIQESSLGKKAVCDYNWLGLKRKGDGASCDGGTHRTFSGLDEMFDYYVHNIISVRKASERGFTNPYEYVDFLVNGVNYGEQYNPNQSYVQYVSALVCGLQEWAKANSETIGDETRKSFNPTEQSDPSSSSNSSDDDGYTSPNCPGSKKEESGGGGGSWDDNDDDDDDDETPDGGDLVDLVKAWVWPDYKGSGYTEKKKAYADYIANATYKGGCDGVDCGAFVANIIKASGWDTSYAQGPTGTQCNYLEKNWQKVSASSLQLGDVGIVCPANGGMGHVVLYIGNIPGINANMVSASYCDRAPMADTADDINRFNWYRKK